VRLSLRRWRAAEPKGEAVVLTHGLGASKNHRPIVAVARMLSEHGYDVVTYDGRGHGTSDGLCTLGELECLDVAAAVARARTDADHVIAVGASMGAIAVLRHAAQEDEPALDGVVALSSPAMWSVPRTPRGIMSIFLTRTRAGRLVASRRLGVRLAKAWSSLDPPAELVARLSVPVAIVHGLRDRFIQPTAARTLYARARDPRRIELVPRMGHAYDDHAVPAVLHSVEWAISAARSRVPTTTPGRRVPPPCGQPSRD